MGPFGKYRNFKNSCIFQAIAGEKFLFRLILYSVGKCKQVLFNCFSRVAELGSLSSGAKMAMKTFVKRVFTIFATNASFLCIIANLQI